MNDKIMPNEGNGATEAPQSFSDRVRSLRLPDRPTGHRRGVAWLPWTLCAVLAVIAGYAGLALSREDKDYQDYLEIKNDFPDPVGTLSSLKKAQAEKAKSNDPKLGTIALESKGYIIPISLIQVSPKVGGMVEELFIKEGDRVKKGDILARLEKIDYLADYNRSMATLAELEKYRDQEIEQAFNDLKDCEAQRDQLMVDYKRSEDLMKDKALPKKDYDQAESAYLSMKFRTRRMEIAWDLLKSGQRDQKIKVAEADVVKAKWRLDNTEVKAPISGIILSKKAEEGNMVNAAAFTSSGLAAASLCEMADLTQMEVDLAIAERDIGKIFKDQVCIVRAEAFMDRTYNGKVSRIMPTGDRSKGSVPVRVKIEIPLEEEGQYLRPEMGALVTFFNKK
jgi:HlyD family secretion protein